MKGRKIDWMLGMVFLLAWGFMSVSAQAQDAMHTETYETSAITVDKEDAYSIPVTSDKIKTLQTKDILLRTDPYESLSKEFPVQLSSVYALSVTGEFGLRMGIKDSLFSGTINYLKDDPGAFVRVVLIDKTAHKEYLVYQKQLQDLLPEEYNSPLSLKIEKRCWETCNLSEPVHSFSLRLEARHGGITINEIAYSDTPVSVTPDTLMAKQNAIVIQKLNSQNLGWIAGETAVSNLTYEQKKRLTGLQSDVSEPLNLQGFEYYRGGIFKMKSTGSSTASRTVSGLPENFTWNDRHGQDWLTPVKDQNPCGSCSIFASTGATEAVANLYFNQLINLDLAEQYVVSCSPRSGVGEGYANCSEIWYDQAEKKQTGRGWGIGEVLDYYVETGAINEICFPYSANDISCSNKCNTPTELIKISGEENWSGTTEDSLKTMLIKQGPLSSGIISLSHAMLLVGWQKDPADGKTVWIFKNSWGKNWGGKPGELNYRSQWGDYWQEAYGNNGYAYVKLDMDNISAIAVKTPIISSVPRQIRCEDKDGDGYCNWGISEQKPADCPNTCKSEKDCDDSDSDLGPYDANYTCTSINNNPLPPNPPYAAFTISPQKGASPLTATLDASSSNDPDGSIVSYEWQINSQVIGTGKVFKYTFSTPGQPEITLTVTDSQGLKAVDKKMITVTGNQPPTVRFTVSPDNGQVPLTVSLNATKSFDIDGSIAAYQWKIGDSVQLAGVNAQHTFQSAGSYKITLTVKDDQGVTGSDDKTVTATGGIEDKDDGEDVDTTQCFISTVAGGN